MTSSLRLNRSPRAILLNMLLAAVSLFFNGFGIYLTIQANIGAAPWDVLNLGISKSLGILYGNASIAVSVTILIIDILLREPIGLSMFIDAFVVGKAVDFFNWLHPVPACRSLAVSIPVLAAGGIVNEAMARASACVGAEGAYAGTRFILSEECRAAQTVKEDILATGADDLIVLTEAGGYLKWRSTPHKVAKQAVAENQKGNLSPSTGSFYLGMFKGDLDAGINTVSSAASLIRSIDSCEDIVNELARGYDC